MPASRTAKLAARRAIRIDIEERSSEQDDDICSHNTDPNGTRIPRPPNAFIVFRSKFWAKEKAKHSHFEKSHREISRMAGNAWRSLSKDEQRPYQEEARHIKEEHHRKYPNYIYNPRKISRSSSHPKRKSIARVAKNISVDSTDTLMYPPSPEPMCYVDSSPRPRTSRVPVESLYPPSPPAALESKPLPSRFPSEDRNSTSSSSSDGQTCSLSTPLNSPPCTPTSPEYPHPVSPSPTHVFDEWSTKDISAFERNGYEEEIPKNGLTFSQLDVTYHDSWFPSGSPPMSSMHLLVPPLYNDGDFLRILELPSSFHHQCAPPLPPPPPPLPEQVLFGYTGTSTTLSFDDLFDFSSFPSSG